MMFPAGLDELRLWLWLAGELEERHGLPLLRLLPAAPQLLMRSVHEVNE